MGELGDLIERYADGQTYRPTDAAMARRLGVSKSAVGKWRRAEAMPTPGNLRALSSLLGVGYMRVLDAALADHGYLPRGGEGRGQQPAPTNAVPDLTDMSDEAETLTTREARPRTRQGRGAPRSGDDTPPAATS